MLKRFLRKYPMLWQAAQATRDSRVYAKSLRDGSFSQHGEDVAIMKLLMSRDARGSYVDIGCNHPFRLSNTYLLYLNGWRGLCVDPLPRFVKLYQRWRPEDQFESVAIDEKPGVIVLHEFGWDALSTLSAETAASYKQNGLDFIRQVEVEVQPLDFLLTRNSIHAPISLLSIDVEGHELSALRSIDLAKWSPIFICLEAVKADGGRNVEAIQYLLDMGYTESISIGYNIIFER